VEVAVVAHSEEVVEVASVAEDVEEAEEEVEDVDSEVDIEVEEEHIPMFL